MRVAIVNGPNINLLGSRETQVYGTLKFEDYYKRLVKQYPDITFTHFQSNIEGELIDKIQFFDKDYDAIILNAAAYTHTSVGIRDAISGISIPVIEVHISNVWSRESFRHTSLISPVVKGVIAGFGLESYKLAIMSLMR
jgi:3-dehydroquinate dehydratase-2